MFRLKFLFNDKVFRQDKEKTYWLNAPTNSSLLPQACWLVEYTETYAHTYIANNYILLFSGQEII